MLPTDHVTDLDRVAIYYAGIEDEGREAAIDAEAMLAIRQCRVADAVFWSKVKFRTRLLRARAQGGRPPRQPSPVACPGATS